MQTFVQMNICTCLHLANVCDNLQLSELIFFGNSIISVVCLLPRHMIMQW